MEDAIRPRPEDTRGETILYNLSTAFGVTQRALGTTKDDLPHWNGFGLLGLHQNGPTQYEGRSRGRKHTENETILAGRLLFLSIASGWGGLRF